MQQKYVYKIYFIYIYISQDMRISSATLQSRNIYVYKIYVYNDNNIVTYGKGLR